MTLANRPVTCVAGNVYFLRNRVYVCSALNTWTLYRGKPYMSNR